MNLPIEQTMTRLQPLASRLLLPSIALLLAGGLPTFAQAPSKTIEKKVPIEKKKAELPIIMVAPPPPSAKQQALATHGTIPDMTSRDKVVANAIYVKLRKHWGGNANAGVPASQANADATNRVAQLVSQAGLGEGNATRIPITIPALVQPPTKVSKNNGALLQRYVRGLQAQDEFSRIIEVRYSAAIHPREAARKLMEFPEVEYAEPMILPQLVSPPLSPNDPQTWQQKQLPQMRAYEAWEVWPGDTNTLIGIVDAGIDMFHEDLAPNISENTGEMGKDALGRDKRTNNLDDDGNGAVDDWRGANLTWQEDSTLPGITKGSAHGTFVTGFASAATNNKIGIAGVGNLCRFFPIKMANNKTGELTMAYEGIIYAARRGCKVINCSWGEESYSRVLQDLITNVVETFDCAIVAGGGNPPGFGTYYPAGYRHVLGVGAVGGNDVYETTLGPHISVSAPGGFSTGENNTYGEVGVATSFSAPNATGALALVRSRYPALTADQAIAHLRQTTENINHKNPDKIGLMGTGRINILRALTDDPFARPAIVLDSVFLTDLNGTPRDNFSVGEQGLLRVRVRNLLGDATNIRITAGAMSDGVPTIQINRNDTAHIAGLLRGGVALAEGGIRFTVTAPTESIVHLRFAYTADSGYSDFGFDRQMFARPYFTASTPDIVASISTRGRLGYHDYPTNTVGDGFLYLGKSLLYEGGFIVAGDGATILSNIRGSDNEPRTIDFGPIDLPSLANDSTLTLTDSVVTDGRKMGIELKLRFVKKAGVKDAIGIELRTRNRSSQRLDSLRIAMFTDWDIAAESGGQTVRYGTDPTGNIAVLSRVENASGYGVTGAIAGDVQRPIFYAINNDGDTVNLYDGFAFSEKWRTISNGIGSQSAGPGDISAVWGKVVRLDPDQEDTTLFLFGMTTPTRQGRQAMYEFLGIPTSVADAAEQPSPGYLGLARPNPTSRIFALRVRTAGANYQLRVFDNNGNAVADLTNQLTASDTTITYDASALPAGRYLVQLSNGSSVASQQVIVVK